MSESDESDVDEPALEDAYIATLSSQDLLRSIAADWRLIGQIESRRPIPPGASLFRKVYRYQDELLKRLADPNQSPI